MLPPRCRHWTQKVHIDGNSFYLAVAEYPDGRPGGIFLDSHKQGTFARGVLDTLARSLSIALQCGTPVAEVVKALRGLDYPPNGTVYGSATVSSATSLADWVAQELEAVYCVRYRNTPPASNGAASNGSANGTAHGTAHGTNPGTTGPGE